MLLRNIAIVFLFSNGIDSSSELFQTLRIGRPLPVLRKRLIISDDTNADLSVDDHQEDAGHAGDATPGRISPSTPETTPSTTKATTKKVLSIAFSNVGCFIKGRSYFEGQFLPGVGSKCQSCYCLRGRSHCANLRCPEPAPNCKPVFDEEKCCPLRYDCDQNDSRVNSKFSNRVLYNDDLKEGDPVSSDKGNIQDFADPDLLFNRVRKDRQKRIRLENGKNEENISTNTEEPESQTTAMDGDATVEESLSPSNEGKKEAMATEDKISHNIDDSTAKANELLVSQLPPTPESIPEDTIKGKSDTETNAKAEEVKELIPGEEDAALRTENKLIRSDIESILADESTTHDMEDENEKAFDVGHVKELEKDIHQPMDIRNEKTDALLPEENAQNDLDYPGSALRDSFGELFPEEGASLSALQELLLASKASKTNNEDTNDQSAPNIDENILLPEDFGISNKEYEEYVSEYDPISYDFPSYDINVGSSMFAGADETAGEGPVGIGQVIPVDLHHEGPFNPFEISPQPSPPTTDSSISFLDAFLNMFGNSPPKEVERTKEKKEPESSPDWPISSSFIPGPLRPPPLVPPGRIPGPLRPPPPSLTRSPVSDPIPEAIQPISKLPEETSLKERLDENETVDNDLPRRRFPFSRPDIFASRPRLPPIHEQLHNAPPSSEVLPPSLFPSLPFDPVIEGGFEVVRRGEEKRPDKVQASLIVMDKTHELPSPPKQASLPPSLPNLEIIPFVAADALVNKAAAHNPDDTRSVLLPDVTSSMPDIADECREGGHVWKNGETVAKGANPCLTCQCILGKIVCSNKECPRGSLPPGCRRFKPQQDECCPVIKCDERPSVKPVTEMEEETTKFDDLIYTSVEEVTNGPRPPLLQLPPEIPSPRPPFRRPLFPGGRRPPFIPDNRRPPLLPPRSPPSKDIPSPTLDRNSQPRRPIPPKLRLGSRPSPVEIPKRHSPAGRPDVPLFSRPFTRRPEFIPPRRPGGLIRRPDGLLRPKPPSSLGTKPIPHFLPDFLTTTEPHTTPSPTTTTSTTTTTTTTTTETQTFPFRQEIPSKPRRPLPEDQDDFFIPPGLLLPLPIPPSNPDPDISNLVHSDPFGLIPSGKPHDDKEHSNVLFNIPNHALPIFPKSTTALPSIPEEISNQFPLGDPMLALGLIELENCNVWGRIYKVGATVDVMSSECKECRCTPVGVQCLPTCPPNY